MAVPASILAGLCLLLLSATPTTNAAHPSKISHVVHIVVDGLRSSHFVNSHVPALDYLIQTGACTPNARPDDRSSQTLPNHISMFTGRAVSDHGYRDDADPTPGANSTHGHTLVDPSSGQKLVSIFDLVDASLATGQTNGRTGLFTSKSKFQLFDRSYPLTSYFENKKSKAVVRRFLNQMTNLHFAYSYLHVVDPDLAGHRYGGAASPEYDLGVAAASYALGQVFDLIASDNELRDSTAIILTADHGFASNGNHADGDDPEVYTIPFCAWSSPSAAVVAPHAELYELNADNGSGVVDPGQSKGTRRKVVRNTYAGVLAADLLGIHPANPAATAVARAATDDPFADQYLAVNDGAQRAAAMTWPEWKAAKAAEYDWSDPNDILAAEEEATALGGSTGSDDEEVGGSSNDVEGDTVAIAPLSPPGNDNGAVPIEEVSKQDQAEDVAADSPVPIEEPEVNVFAEEVPIPVQEEEEEEVVIQPNKAKEDDKDVSMTNALSGDDKMDLWENLSKSSQDNNDEKEDIEEGAADLDDLSAFMKVEETPYDDQPPTNGTGGLTGAQIGLVASFAVALLAMGFAVYVYVTTPKKRAKMGAVSDGGDDDLEKAAHVARSSSRLDETRVSVSSSGDSDDGSSYTLDEESCIFRHDGHSATMDMSTIMSRNARRFTLNEAASAHAQAVEAGAWPDDVAPLEAVEVEAVEVTATDSKAIWHVVSLQN